MKQNQPKLEKPSIFYIGTEEMEVWPAQCTRRGQNCYQCYLEGKVLCAPRFQTPARVVRRDLVQKLSLDGCSLKHIAGRTGLSLSEVYTERARLREKGVPLPRIGLGKGEVL